MLLQLQLQLADLPTPGLDGTKMQDQTEMESEALFQQAIEEHALFLGMDPTVDQKYYQ